MLARVSIGRSVSQSVIRGHFGSVMHASLCLLKCPHWLFWLPSMAFVAGRRYRETRALIGAMLSL